MKYKFYTTSEKAWQGMLAAIKEARHYIYWESYIFYPDVEGGYLTQEIFQALAEKARTGIEVKIIADYWGSFFFSAKARKFLEDFGAEVLFFKGHKIFGRNHKKILIIDGKVAFIGGVNLAKHHKDWLDLHLRLESGGVINYLQRSFTRSYYKAGGKDKIELRKPQLAQWKVKFIEHWPAGKRRLLKRHYKDALDNARRSILIATPYFVPHPWLVRRLHRAAKKGVLVSIIIPEITDNFIINLANYCFASLVYLPGINFYFTKQFVHAKALLIDDREGLIGSQNIDALSFDHNIEGGVIFQRKDMVEELKKILEDWQKDAKLLVFKQESRRWYNRLLEVIFKLLRPIL